MIFGMLVTAPSNVEGICCDLGPSPDNNSSRTFIIGGGEGARSKEFHRGVKLLRRMVMAIKKNMARIPANRCRRHGLMRDHEQRAILVLCERGVSTSSTAVSLLWMSLALVTLDMSMTSS